jgi:hypothetical protein
MPNTNCVPPPFDGDLLQIMAWPIYQHMTDHDLRAIYEYLSAIPTPVLRHLWLNRPFHPGERDHE